MWASLAAIPIKSVYKDYKSLKKMKKEKAMLRAKYMKSDGATLKTRGDVRSAAQLSFQSLYKSALVAVTDYRCRACRGGPAAEERADSHNIVILRHGVFSKHLGRHKVTADVNQAVFFSKDLPYRVSHPADCPRETSRPSLPMSTSRKDVSILVASLTRRGSRRLFGTLGTSAFYTPRISPMRTGYLKP